MCATHALLSSSYPRQILRKAVLWWRVGILACLCLAACSQALAIGTWVPLPVAPGSIGLMLLLPDGTVMAHRSSTSSIWYRLTPDSAGHYVTGTWSTLASMHDTRLYYSSQVLKDGRVFVAGGEYGTGYRTGESYDPITNKWLMAPATSPSQGISDACSALLPDGKVLVAPVSASPFLSTILWNPDTNTWTTGPSVRGNQNEAVWVKLPDDSLLTVDIGSTNSERYIPSLNQWVADSTVPVSLYDPYGYETGGGFLLPNGNAFFLGSLSHTAIYTPSGTTSPGTWSAGPDIPGPSGTPDAPAVMLPNGKILVAVSPIPTSPNHFPSPTTFYEYDYVANSFTAVPTPSGITLNHPSYYGTMLCLPDGTALYSDFNSQVYNYQPDGSPLAAGKPTIAAITQNLNGTFHLTGTQLNGISEGSSYGDDNQNSTNYPIIRLTSGGGTVYHARTFNWSHTGVATGSTPVSTEFTVPPGVPLGTYSLTVIANGIASDPISFNYSTIQVALPASASEGGSPVFGTVTLPTPAVGDTEVPLTSSVPARATVPTSVMVLAGQTSANFAVTPGDDSSLNGSVPLAVSASAVGYAQGVGYMAIIDNENAILAITPSGSTSFTGTYGGPFTPSSGTYTLTNNGNTPLTWTESKSSSSWLTVSPTSGTLAAGASANVTLTLTATANTTAVGSYSATLTFVNSTTGDGNATRTVSFVVGGAPTMGVTAGSLNSSGPSGGSFTPSSSTFTVSNSGTGPLSWTAAKTASWLTLSPSSGTVSPGGSTVVTASINTAANSLSQGAYSDTITFTNGTNGVGNTSRAVSLLAQAKINTFNFTSNPGWSMDGGWAFGQPTGGGGGGGGFSDPVTGYDGSAVFGVNLAGNYSTTPGGPFYLTSGPMNLSGSVSSKVRFRRWLNTDYQPYAAATLEVSSNGSTWTTVWDNGSSAATLDSSWQLVQYDISAVADLQSTVYLRWGYSVAAGATAMSGWNIDNVEILGSTGITVPTASEQTLAVGFGVAKAVTLTGVDTNSPPSPLTFAVSSSPSHGTLTGTVPNLTYTPAIGYSGVDSFTFRCTNGFNLTSAPATITLNVAPGMPLAASQAVTVPVDTATNITLVGSDPDVPPLPLSFAVQVIPQHGTLSGTAPNLIFTPTPGYEGPDSLTFTVSNGANISAPGFVSINVGVGSVVEVRSPPALYPGSAPRGRLAQGVDGNFYGTTQNGGGSGQGTIFRMTSGGTITTLAEFYGANGEQPVAGLVLASDGYFYGTTSLGGPGNLGTIFRVSSAGQLTTLVYCNAVTGTSPKAALVQGADGNLYGSTTGGGTSSSGTLFKMTLAGEVTVLVNLRGTVNTAYGSNTQAAMIQGLDGNFYGVCGGGGANSVGTLFKLTPSGTFTTLVSFTGTSGAAPGSTPLGPLVQGADGTLYGATTTSGIGGTNGTIFKCTTSGTLTTMATFTGSTGSTLGGNCQGGLTFGNDGVLYGTTVAGPTYGSLFKITTAGVFTSLRTLISTTDGIAPYGGLLRAANGNLYGITGNSLATSTMQRSGTVFVWNPTLATFATVGTFPFSPPGYMSLFQHTDSSVYGVSSSGGANGAGSVVKISDTGVVSTLASFNFSDGAAPIGLIAGSDGNFYGMCVRGGATNLGGIFKVTPSGTLTLLSGFSSLVCYNPVERLTEAGDGNFYAACRSGGTNSLGAVFRVTPSGVFTRLESFTGTSGALPGSTPTTRLTLGGDGNLYGTTNSGGAANSGTVYRVVVASGVVESVVSFTGTSGGALGSSPLANLLQANDGNLYGVTSGGGSSSAGTVFKLTTSGTFTTLFSFTGSTGAYRGSSPSSSLIQGADGGLYGTTTGTATAYRCSLAGDFTSLALFTGTAGALPGANPRGEIWEADDGWFYGVSVSGGAYNLGTLYRFHPSGLAQALYTFGSNPDGGSQSQLTVTYDAGANHLVQGPGNYLWGGNGSALFRVRRQPAPQLLTATSITPDSATLSTSLVPNEDDADVYFEYGLSLNYGSQTAVHSVMALGGASTINEAITGLQSGVLYHYRLVTVSAQGIFYSQDMTFATPGAPLVITGSFVAVGQTGFSCEGLVNPLGDPTLYWFEYGDEEGAYEHQTAPSSAGSGQPIVPVEDEDPQNASNGIAWIQARATVNLLAPGDAHFRLVASNGYGVSYGEDQVVHLLPATTSLIEPMVHYTGIGVAPQAGLVLGNDGHLYGTTSTGGSMNNGTVFRLTSGGTLTTLASFHNNLNSSDEGSSPQAVLVQGTDGRYYGTTTSGGTGGFGTVFAMTPGGEVTTLVSFTSTSGLFLGSSPNNGLSLGPDGSFYGVTASGGSTSSFGTIYKVTQTGEFTSLALFTGATGANRGSAPRGPLVLGSDGNFYGVTSLGGTGGFGTIFKVTPSGVMTTLVDFTGTTGLALGSSVNGGLVEGQDGNFYGTTSTGGVGNVGTVFRVTPTGTFTSLVSFTGTTGATVGSSPKGTLTRGPDGSFFGCASTGGSGTSFGTVFKITPAGVLTTIVSFTGTSGSAPVATPNGGLVLLADGSLYGTSSSGGLNNSGTVFKISSDGLTTVLLNFTPTPVVSQLTQAVDGKLYGTTTAAGGALGWGSAFSLVPGESPLFLAALPPSSGTTALASRGGFLETGDGTLWASSAAGGSLNLGSVFKITPTGTVNSVLSFTGSTGGVIGSSPQSGLVLGGDGSFWGTTSSGGSGTVFKITPAGVHTKLLSFTGTTGAYPGSNPQAPLLLGSNGFNYGTTTTGGSSNFGTIFKLDSGGTLTSLVTFSGPSGSTRGQSPQGQLVQAQDGKLYGSTSGGGTNGSGTVFRMTATGTFENLASFTGTTGSLPGTSPTAGVATGADGQIYGTTNSGGAYNVGTVFRVANDGSVRSLAAFTGRENGSLAGNGGLFLAEDGHLYGGTSTGVFRLNLPPVPLAEPATDVLTASATLNGAVTGEGFSGTMWFEYGTSMAYGQTTPVQSFSPGIASLPVVATVSGLNPFLTYHYRLVVSCAQGVSSSLDMTFSTPDQTVFNTAQDVPVSADGFSAEGRTLNVTLGFMPPPGVVLTLVNNTGLSPIAGTFNLLPEGAGIVINYSGTDYLFEIHYGDGDGNDITLTRVDQVITFAPISTKPTASPPFALGASASSTLPISYEVVAGSSLATIAGDVVTLSGASGIVTIKATQAGNGSTIGAATPVYRSFAVADGGFVQMTASKVNDACLAIRANGTLWAWGNNGASQLGDATLVIQRTPVQIGTNTTWTYVSTGGGHTLALRSDGTLWGWGTGTTGQVGNGSASIVGAPVQVGASKTWAQVSAGANHTAAIATDGTLWVWGSNASGQLGNGTTDTSVHTLPVQVGSSTNWRTTAGSLSAGGDFILALQTDGSLYAWGLNSSGQIGDGTTTSKTSPTLISSGWSRVCAGTAFSTALRADGTLWSWGLNSSGQVGDGSLSNRTSPVQISADNDWAESFCGGAFGLAAKTDGSLWSWGINSVGHLGQGFASSVQPSVPARIQDGGATWLTAAAGGTFAIAARQDTTLWAWGAYSNGQQAILPYTMLPLAAPLGAVVGVTAGVANTLVTRADGSLLIWGSNSSGQLGLGVGDSIPHPAPVPFGSGQQWQSVSMGSASVLAVASNGTLWGCGVNSSSQLGDGTTIRRNSLLQIGSETDWQTVHQGNAHSLAIKQDGSLWAWGSNASGQLGDGTSTARSIPVQIGADHDWVKIAAANSSFSIAQKADGSLWSWGSNSSGQLGDGTTTSSNRPAKIGTATDWIHFAAGSTHVLAVKADGSLWAWGNNSTGQVGDGTFTNRTSPTQIGIGADWRSISAGSASSFAIRADGSLWAWGSNSSGQLSNGSYTAQSLPTQVGTSDAWASLPSTSVSTTSHLLVMAKDGSLWACGFAANGQTAFAGRDLFTPQPSVPGIGGPQTIAFSPPGSAVTGSTVTLGATSSSGLPASYLVTGPATRHGDQLTITGPGPITVIAYQPGNGYWSSSDIAYAVINAPLPVVTTLAATDVTGTSVVLHGTVNPSGYLSAAEFEIGATNAYGTHHAVALLNGAGGSNEAVSVTLTGLTPSTTYHFRAAATNSGGTATGDDLTFITHSLYDDWVASQGLTGTGTAANDDYDFDGIPNLLEWSFGLNAAIPAVGDIATSGGVLTRLGQPIVQGTPGARQAVFGRRVNYLSEGLIYIVEFSPDLQFWEASAAIPTVIATNGAIEAAAVPFPAQVNGQPTRFFHVRVSVSD